MSAASRKRVICVGHAALDRVFAVESWPAGSGKIAAHRFEESGGGMAANAAAAIARLGGEAVFWGPTGEDAVADAIRATLIADGVDAHGLRCFEGRTSSHSAVIVDDRGERLNARLGRKVSRGRQTPARARQEALQRDLLRLRAVLR